MATGDNYRTAISVARECGLISQSIHVFFPTFATGTFLLYKSSSLCVSEIFTKGDAQTPQSTLRWSSVDDDMLQLDPYSLKPTSQAAHHNADSGSIEYHDYTLAVTGDVFRWMINNAPLETLQRVIAPSTLTRLVVMT